MSFTPKRELDDSSPAHFFNSQIRNRNNSSVPKGEMLVFENLTKSPCQQKHQIFYSQQEQQSNQQSMNSQNISPRFNDKPQLYGIDQLNITPIFQRISSELNQSSLCNEQNNFHFNQFSSNKYIRRLDFEQIKTPTQPYPTFNKKQQNLKNPPNRHIDFNENQKIQQNNSSKRKESLVIYEVKQVRSKKNGVKSLKSLTSSIVQIVKQYNSATYKDIANQIVSKIIKRQRITPNHHEKDITSTKRRIYDALNVLISSNILQKHGKIVSIYGKEIVQDSTVSESGSNNIEKLRQQLEYRKRVLNYKNQKLNVLYSKYKSALSLRQRNKLSSSQRKVVFPFVFINYPKDSNVQFFHDEKSLRICLDRPFKMWGDVDMVNKLQIKSKELFTQSQQSLKEMAEYLQDAKIF